MGPATSSEYVLDQGVDGSNASLWYFRAKGDYQAASSVRDHLIDKPLKDGEDAVLLRSGVSKPYWMAAVSAQTPL